MIDEMTFYIDPMTLFTYGIYFEVFFFFFSSCRLWYLIQLTYQTTLKHKYHFFLFLIPFKSIMIYSFESRKHLFMLYS